MSLEFLALIIAALTLNETISHNKFERDRILREENKL